ncbi:MAG: polymer-forming cytoskeletal protein [Candidatus Latescibacteria bacterium]|nr:polymer-forming cytoskeletal protein [Candidatus Latescibacterota bacterium]
MASSKLKDLVSSESKGINTIIGHGAVVEGTLTVPHGIRVDGHLKGDVRSAGILIVGEDGVIEADVKVKDATISGKIIGDVDADGKVHLKAQAVLLGKIKTRLLVVEEGAIFKGNCESGEEVQVSKAPERMEVAQKGS